MKKHTFILPAFLIIALIFFSCKKDAPPDDNNTDITTTHGVFIVNEGNFQWSNASVTYKNFTNNDYNEDIFKSVNNRPLGDVAQSICYLNGYAYIVVNNSNKIEIVNLSDFSSIGVITGLGSPRYFLPVSASKAYVSDLYNNYINVIDLSTLAKTQSIPCNGSTEEMVLQNNIVYITNTRKNKIYLIDVNADEITDSITVGFASNSLQIDKNGKLWVMCSGDVASNINASIHRINTQNKQVEQSFQLSTPLDIWDKMRINPSRDTLYYMNNGIFRMQINSTLLPENVFIPQGSSLFHGLAINPVNSNIFVADAVDYIQKGKVNFYSPDGVLLGTINTGIIPVDFYFY